MNIVITGNYNINNTNKYIIHKILRPEYKLYVGSKCNNGRPITESWRYKQALKLGIPIIRKTPIVAKAAQAAQSVHTNIMFVDKYAPKTINDVIGHKEQIKHITAWLQNWKTCEKKGLLITGPTGIGKTTVAHLVATELGYIVSEYNASDTRSIAMLRSIAFGAKRLISEVIIMDEIDGSSERGGIGELASIIKKTHIPIICIANDKPPKLKPIINVCLDIKFNRPVKSTIAIALLKIATAENINTTKVDLEDLCEKNGNDIRSILNNLEFYGRNATHDTIPHNKDSLLRLDAFSATQRLIGNKKISFEDSTNLVFVDYGLVPLMVQEAYITSSKDSLDNIVNASEFLSMGDIMDKKLHTTHDWNILPYFVSTVVAAARTVSGPSPFQLFPQWLGKNSRRLKHRRLLGDMSSNMKCSQCSLDTLRLDYIEPLYTIGVADLIIEPPNIKRTVSTVDSIKLTRDDLLDTIPDILLGKIEIPTKAKSAFTREYNKVHSTPLNGRKRKVNELKVDNDTDNDNLYNGDLTGLETELNTIKLT